MSELADEMRAAALDADAPHVQDALRDGADALDAQAQEIARLTAKLPCGHLETDADSYGGCAACGVLRSLESAEKECDALRERLADAERYRWLRDDWLLGGAMAPGIFGAGTAENLEAIIDKARGGA